MRVLFFYQIYSQFLYHLIHFCSWRCVCWGLSCILRLNQVILWLNLDYFVPAFFHPLPVKFIIPKAKPTNPEKASAGFSRQMPVFSIFLFCSVITLLSALQSYRSAASSFCHRQCLRQVPSPCTSNLHQACPQISGHNFYP